jgi:alkylhydroperoxidase family enzyme
MPRIPYYEVENATGKHAELLGKLNPMLNIYRMLANSEQGAKGFLRMGNGLLYRCELDPVLRELAIIRVGRLSRTAYEVFQHERIGREGRGERGEDRRPARRHHRGAGLHRQ